MGEVMGEVIVTSFFLVVATSEGRCARWWWVSDLRFAYNLYGRWVYPTPFNVGKIPKR